MSSSTTHTSVNNTSGGEPGANIRVAFLYNPARVDTVGGTDSVVDPTDQQTNPANPFWDTRPPLVQTFEFDHRDFVVVNNHFASKTGSHPCTELSRTRPSGKKIRQ